MALTIAAVRETSPSETRVAVTPTTTAQLAKRGLRILVERGAGRASGHDDSAYTSHGAEVADRNEVLAQADVLLQVRCIELGREADWAALRPGVLLVGFADPLGDPTRARAIAARGASLLAVELIPRITRAQAMDALSSQASIAGYKAVLLAASASPKIFPLWMTAAGTLQASRVFVIGAGVAGLQAIATAKRLGAVVSAFDVRAAAREQVQSVGARFVEVGVRLDEATNRGGYAAAATAAEQEAQAALLSQVVADNDVVITTASVPGKPAPKLVTREAVDRMRRGSVIVDLAAERGGNCALTVPGQTVDAEGVTIMGPLDLAATVPAHASLLYANNLSQLLGLIVRKDGTLALDRDDEIVAGSLVTHGGEVVHPRVRDLLAKQDAATPPPPKEAT